MPESEITKLSPQDIINLEHGQLRALINSMADGVIATDSYGKITLYNGAALSVLDSNKLESQPIGNVLQLLDKYEQPIDATRLIISTKTQTVSRDYLLRIGENTVINVYVSIAPVKPSFGSVEKAGFVILIRDITHEKSVEEERDEFISVVSHELRTPVTIAEGNVSNALLSIERGTGTPETIRNAINQARDQITFLSSLINDLSTLSRAENKTLDVNYVSINVPQLIQTLAENYKPSCEKKNLQLFTTIDPTLELLYSSSLYVREILQNFITNAIKYSERGSVTIGAKQAEHGVEFSVTDTGIGMSKTDQEQIFNKFFRSEDYRTRKSSGTGLGLYVTRKLSKLIGAEISVESTLDVGSTFKIYVPSREPSKLASEQLESSN